MANHYHPNPVQAWGGSASAPPSFLPDYARALASGPDRYASGNVQPGYPDPNNKMLTAQTRAALEALSWDDRFSPFFGRALKPATIDDTLAHDQTHYHLPDNFKGTNAHMVRILLNGAAAIDHWATDIAFPKKKWTGGDTITWDTLQFNDHLLNRRIEEGVSRMLSSNRSQGSAQMVGYGIAFMLTHEFMRTPQGRQQYMYQIQQIAAAVRSTEGLSVTHALLNPGSYIDPYARYRPETMRTIEEIDRILDHEKNEFGAFVKDDRGFETCIARANKAIQERVGFPGTCVIYPVGADRWINDKEALYCVTGQVQPRGKLSEAVTADRMTCIPASMHIQEGHMPRLDPTVRPVVFGAFNFMTSTHLRGFDPKQFTIDMLNIQIMSARKDDFVTITHETAARASGQYSAEAWISATKPGELPATDLGHKLYPGDCTWGEVYRAAGELDHLVEALLADQTLLAEFATTFLVNAQAGAAPVFRPNARLDFGAGVGGGNEWDPFNAAVVVKNAGYQQAPPAGGIQQGQGQGQTDITRLIGGFQGNAGTHGIATNRVQHFSDALYLWNVEHPPIVAQGQNPNAMASMIISFLHEVITNYQANNSPLSQQWMTLAKHNTFDTAFNALEQLQPHRDYPATVKFYLQTLQMAAAFCHQPNTTNENILHALQTLNGIQVTMYRTGHAPAANFADLLADFQRRQGRNRVQPQILPAALAMLAWIHDLKIPEVEKTTLLTTVPAAIALIPTLQEKHFNNAQLLAHDVLAAAQQAGDAPDVVARKRATLLTRYAFAALYSKLQNATIHTLTANLVNNAQPNLLAAYLSDEMIQQMNQWQALAARAARIQVGVGGANGANLGNLPNAVIAAGQAFAQGNQGNQAVADAVNAGIAALGPRGVNVAALTHDDLVAFLLSVALFPMSDGFFYKWVLAKKKLPVALGYLLFRPHIQQHMATMIVFCKGGVTGHMYMRDDGNFELGDDPSKKMHYGHYTKDFAAVVENPQTVVHCRDVCPADNGYKGGYGHSFWDASSDDHIQSYKRGSLKRDIFSVPVLANFELNTSHLSITGHYSGSLNPSPEANEITFFPSASLYAEHWGWETAPLPDADFSARTLPQANTMVFQGTQMNMDPYNHCMSIKTVGKTHYGQNEYAGMMRVWNGHERTLLKPSHDNIPRMRIY